MAEVGIRALKQNASAVIAQVVAGDVITVTDRGRPVARVVPIRKSRLDEMIDAGLATKATRSIDDLPPPAPRRPDQPSSAKILEELREDRV